MAKQYTVRCKELLPSGNGLVTFNNSNFEVAGVLPGEKCTIELVYRKEGTGAKLVEVIEPSKERVPVKCPVYDRCGGCNLLHMSYESELKFKSEKVKKLYQDINVLQLPIIKNDNFEHYRNKIYASFSFEKRGRGDIRQIAGMYEENTRKVVNCSDCLIQNPIANSIIKTILDLMRLTGTRSYDPDTKTGVLRHAYIRVAQKSGRVMLVLVTGVPDFKDKTRFVQTLTKKHPCIETIIHNINPGKTGMILGNRDNVIYGKGFITDELCGCTFKISPKSFYQVNPKQTEKLYNAAVDLAGLQPTDTVIDAYSGIGTISLIAAKKAGKVIGIEINKDAVKDARENAKINSATNVEFLEGDAGDYLEKEAKKVNPDVIFMDPPRSGSDEKFLNAVCTAAPERIVYISCNPETQVRDVKYLTEHGYAPKVLQPVDMFSRTGHVETVVQLSKGDIDNGSSERSDAVKAGDFGMISGYSKGNKTPETTNVKIDFSLENLDLSELRGKATYEQIKDYVRKQTGFRVSTLYISQVKKKCGLEVGESYNKPKSEDAKQPQCTPEKEEAIMQALRHYGVI